MKIVYSILFSSIVLCSCQDSAETSAVAVPLKSDTTFVMTPELPAKDSQAADQNVTEEKNTTTSTKKSSSKSKTTTSKSSSSTNTAGNNSTLADNGSGTTQPAAGEPEKKGWSKTAKGAVIGGVVGAGTGAIVNKKNRVAGAVIGGVIGAGAGAVIGNEMDKKDGRH